MGEWRLGVDIGGTFTDLVALGADGEVRVRKVPSTPDDISASVLNGMALLLDDIGAKFSDVAEIVHGTTVGSNTLLQRSGARTGVLTTKGFRDVLEIGRIRTPTMFDLTWEKPEPISPRRIRLEVEERIAADGSIVTPLDLDDVRRAALKFKENEVEAVAISFLSSYTNSDHEQQAKKLLAEEAPSLLVTASSDVLPEMKEYERTSTTVINAYLLREMRRYLDKLIERLRENQFSGVLLVMTSSGGMVSIESASEKPVFLVGSGPAGGVIGAARLAEAQGLSEAIAFDMGGTTAKASIIVDGKPVITNEYEFRDGISSPSRFIKGGGYMIKAPAIDVAEVGAGGGSLAWIDEGGLSRVGPHSAGADPGPACYGRGNDKPTVTDANVVLGYLNPDELAGGELLIQSELSEKAIQTHIGQPLGLSLIEAALGVRKLANLEMARAIRAITVERGLDPRDMVLMAFGGGGPLHGVDVAALLGISRVIITPMSGVFCSVGMLASDVEHNDVTAFVTRLDRARYDRFSEIVAGLKERAIERLSKEGFGDDAISLEFQADLRYVGQSSELPVLFSAAESSQSCFPKLYDDFQENYLRSYGYTNDEPVEFVNVRVVARGRRESRLKFDQIQTQAGTPSNKTSARLAYFEDGEGVETPVLDRSSLTAERIEGPVIIEAYDTTILVPPHASVYAEASDSVAIDLAENFAEL